MLFVCSQNQVRSLTAEVVYRGRPDLEVKSAGLAEYATVPLTQELFDWADEVFVFSKRQRAVIEERFHNSSGGKTVICLHLPDRFEYKSPELIMKLTMKLQPYIGKPAKREQDGATVSPAPATGAAQLPLFRQSRFGVGGVGAWAMV